MEDRHRSWLYAFFLVAIVLAAYAPALSAGFIWDDDFYVTNNWLLTAPDGLRRIWFSLDSPSQYFPLTYTTFLIEHFLWGFNPLGYHLINVLLHAANAFLVWSLLARLRIPGAWLAAGVFAVHPVHVESVAWVTERKNVLMCFFFLLTLLAWCRFIDPEIKRRWVWYTIALIFYLLALAAKSTACTLPAALLLILWLQRKPINGRRLVETVPFFLLGLAAGLIAIWWERFHQGTIGPEFAFSFAKRLLIFSHAAWFYPAKLFWPAKLTFIYPQWNIDPTNPLQYLWTVAVVAVCAAIYFGRRYFGRGPEVAVAFFIATLVPVMGPIMLYTFRYTYVADHYQYVASIGLIALFAAAASGISARLNFGGGAKFAATIALLFVLCVLTWRQTGIYRDQETLWRDTVAKNPQGFLGHLNLGVALSERGQTDPAKSEYEEALRLNPKSFEVFDLLGVWEAKSGRLDDAVLKFKTSLQLFPTYPAAWFNLGNAFLAKGELEDAIAAYQNAIRYDPYLADAHGNLAVALSRVNRLDQAVPYYIEALHWKPNDPGVHYNFGIVLAQLGRTEEAAAQFKEALRLKPDYEDARRRLRELQPPAPDK
jgi:protein O-mannosyl-transferase